MTNENSGDVLDVLIVGNGIGARCAAMALNQVGSGVGDSLSIAAIALPDDSVVLPAMLVSPPCQQFLQNIGAWPSVSVNASWIDTLHVSEQGRLGATRFTGADMSAPNLGSVVRSDALRSALPEVANTISCAALTGLSVDDEAGVVRITVNDSENTEACISARLVLVADEGVAALSALQSLKAAEASSAVSLVGTVANNHDNVTYQRYIGDSKITVLPGAGPRDVSVVIEGAAATELAAEADEPILPKVQALFGHRLGRFGSLTVEAKTALTATVPVVRQSRIVELGSPAVAAPFAPGNLHGCCYAIASLLSLLGGDESVRSAAIGRQLAVQLENYQPITAGLDRLFAAELGPLNHLRGAGLMALELATPLRQRLLKRQLGQQALLPPLMRSSGQLAEVFNESYPVFQGAGS